jgi:hypothetical protein
MSERLATCRCGQFRVRTQGEPVRVSICHCLDCQKRSGSAFAFQARWPEEKVEFSGDFKSWSTVSESGNRATFRFCPDCGSTIAYSSDGLPDLIAVAVGAFADPQFPQPHYSVYESRKHGWLAVTCDGIEHYD